MANPYTITINFPERQLLVGRHKLTLVFTVNWEGTNTSLTAEDEGIYLLKLGEYEIDIDLDNLLMNPATMSFEILDQKRVLWTYLYHDDWTVLEKTALVRFEIDRGSGYEVEFEGNIIASNISDDEVLNVLQLKASTLLGALYDVKLFDQNTTTGAYTWHDPLDILGDDSIYITDLVEAIYKYLDPAITIDIFQDWTFRGQQWANSENPPDWEEYISDDLPFTAVWVRPTYFFQNSEYPTLGDVLKQLAFDFGCHTGMLTNKKAFFRKLYPAMPGSYITISEDDVITKERTQREYYQGVKLTIQRYYEGVDTLEFFIGRKSNVRDAYLEGKSSFWFRDINPLDDPNRSDSNYYLHSGDDFPYDFHLYLLKLNESSLGSDITFWDKDVTQAYPSTNFDSPVFQVGRYYYKHRCVPAYLNMMRFEVSGNDYTILTDILHEGQYFHVISLSKDYHRGTTVIDALRIN